MRLVTLILLVLYSTGANAQYTSCCASFPDSALCGCQDGIIQCRNLPTVPSIFQKRVCRVLDIRQSVISITPDAFRNIQADEVRITNCQLNDSMIDAHAFMRIADSLKSLVLANNNLTKLPTALNELTNLEYLDVSENPIRPENFQEDILRELGDTLLGLQFGSRLLDSWPKTLTHLPRLEKLNVTRAVFSLIPNDAFHGFQGALKELTMQNTLLTSVPLAVSTARYLEVLNFDDNQKVGDYGVNIPIIPGFMPYLYNVSLQADNISTFPAVLGAFHRLTNLKMDRNNLKFVSDQSANAARRITRLSLRSSNITRIPGALQNITDLTNLDLSYNSIHSVERRDIEYLRHLTTLKLNHNPIVYISGDAFSHNARLTHLELQYTNLTQVPCAVQWLIRVTSPNPSIVRHVTVDLSHNEIECNCGLQWIHSLLKIFTQTKLKVLGDCSTIVKPLQDYIDQELAFCPDGVSCTS